MSRKRGGGVAERGALTCPPDLDLAAKSGELAPGEASHLPRSPARTSDQESVCKSLTKVCLVVESSTAPPLCAHSYSHVCRHTHTRMHEHTFAHIWGGTCSWEVMQGVGSPGKPKPPVSPSQEPSPELPRLPQTHMLSPPAPCSMRAGRLPPHSTVAICSHPGLKGCRAVPVQPSAPTRCSSNGTMGSADSHPPTAWTGDLLPCVPSRWGICGASTGSRKRVNSPIAFVVSPLPR